MNNVGGVGKDYATTDQRMSTTMLGVSFCTNEGIMHASSLVRLSDGTDRDPQRAYGCHKARSVLLRWMWNATHKPT